MAKMTAKKFNEELMTSYVQLYKKVKREYCESIERDRGDIHELRVCLERICTLIKEQLTYGGYGTDAFEYLLKHSEDEGPVKFDGKSIRYR